MKIVDQSMVGQKFNSLTVIGFKKDKWDRNRYLCKCDCGNEILTNKAELISGRKKSCGCLKVNAVEKYNYLVGQKINKWTILEIKMGEKVCCATCICECGTIKDVNIYNLLNNKTKDCGCGRKQMLRETKSKNLIGMRFGKLVAVELLDESNKFNRRLYKCKCDCGNEIIVPSSSLTTNHTMSCGCLLSYYNMYIDMLLDKLNVVHKKEKVIYIEDIMYRFDFYLPDYNLMIEYDGEQHYMSVNFGENNTKLMEERLKIRQKNDQIKNNYCKANNINLLRIPYWERQNIEIIITSYLQRLNERAS